MKHVLVGLTRAETPRHRPKPQDIVQIVFSWLFSKGCPARAGRPFWCVLTKTVWREDTYRSLDYSGKVFTGSWTAPGSASRVHPNYLASKVYCRWLSQQLLRESEGRTYAHFYSKAKTQINGRTQFRSPAPAKLCVPYPTSYHTAQIS